MQYRTVDEVNHFEFKQAEVDSVEIKQNHFYLNLNYVTILPENTCNRDIRKMGARELILDIQNYQIEEFVEEGYRVFDPDGKLLQTCEDKFLKEEEYAAAFEKLQDTTIYAFQRTEREDEERPYHYEVEIDAEENSYHIYLNGKHDVEEWDRFMNIEASY